MEPLKDQFFNKLFITTLATDVKAAVRDFDSAAFTKRVFDRQWKNRELKDRMHHIADCLYTALDRNYKSCIRLLTPIVQRRIKEKTNSFGDMIFPDFVERYGLADFNTSVKALEIFTAACSSEFAVRPFIVHYGDRMMQKMLQWSKHRSEHVRRLSSEGCRPRLPWAMALPEFKKDPRPVLQILENLKSDTSEYVRRSVANNLNDIAKDNLETALTTAERWFGLSEETNALVRHALRNELKKGNPRALKLFALAQHTRTQVKQLKVTPEKISIGASAEIQFMLVSTAAERLRIEYWVFFVKSGGKTSKKVFQIAEREFGKGARHVFKKKHRFQDLTTRKHYAGEHKVIVAINGKPKASATLTLLSA